MNELCIYIALYVYCCKPKALYNHVLQSWSLLNKDQCAASTCMMRWLSQYKCSHHTPATGGEERESHRANQVYALTTHQLQVERRESHRANQVYALTIHQLQVERRESHRDNQVYALHHTPSYRWRGERVKSQSSGCVTTHPATGGEEERVIEPIKCMLSPHTSYRWIGRES